MYEIVYGIVYGFGDGSVDDAVAGGINDMDNDTAAAQCMANPGESLSCAQPPALNHQHAEILVVPRFRCKALNMEDGSV